MLLISKVDVNVITVFPGSHSSMESSLKMKSDSSNSFSELRSANVVQVS